MGRFYFFVVVVVKLHYSQHQCANIRHPLLKTISACQEFFLKFEKNRYSLFVGKYNHTGIKNAPKNSGAYLSN
jgi:hypothetical protein